MSEKAAHYLLLTYIFSLVVVSSSSKMVDTTRNNGYLGYLYAKVMMAWTGSPFLKMTSSLPSWALYLLNRRWTNASSSSPASGFSVMQTFVRDAPLFEKEINLLPNPTNLITRIFLFPHRDRKKLVPTAPPEMKLTFGAVWFIQFC